MIDIHTHVLPGVDDGSESMEMSLSMLALAADSGVDTLVTTPHCNIPDEIDNYADAELEERWEELNAEKDRMEIPIRLCRGMEIFATPEMPKLLREHRVWTLNGTDYFLMEFAFDEDPVFCFQILEDCVREGFRPIIAHPERYFFLQDDPQIAFEWCTAGYGLQEHLRVLAGAGMQVVERLGQKVVAKREYGVILTCGPLTHEFPRGLEVVCPRLIALVLRAHYKPANALVDDVEVHAVAVLAR